MLEQQVRQNNERKMANKMSPEELKKHLDKAIEYENKQSDAFYKGKVLCRRCIYYVKTDEDDIMAAPESMGDDGHNCVHEVCFSTRHNYAALKPKRIRIRNQYLVNKFGDCHYFEDKVEKIKGNKNQKVKRWYHHLIFWR